MAWLDFGITSLLILFVFVCFLLCLLILMQRTKNDGIGSAIASGVTQKYIGVQTSNVLVKGTVWFTVMFFLIALVLDHLYTMRATALLEHRTSLHQQFLAPVATPAPLIISPVPSGAPTPASGVKPTVNNPAVPPTPQAAPVPAPSTTPATNSPAAHPSSPGTASSSKPTTSQAAPPTKPR